MGNPLQLAYGRTAGNQGSQARGKVAHVMALVTRARMPVPVVSAHDPRQLIRGRRPAQLHLDVVVHG